MSRIGLDGGGRKQVALKKRPMPIGYDLSGENGVVIYFNRSLDWCPICLRQALEVDAAQEAFEAAGWGVALLTYDSSQTLARVADQR